MAHGLKELLWTYQTLLTMGVQIQLPMALHEDNQAFIQIADNPISQRRTRHVDIRYHFVRDYIEDGTISVRYCPTADMLDDIITKAMYRPMFQGLRNKIIGDVLKFIDNNLLVTLAYCRSIYDRITV